MSELSFDERHKRQKINLMKHIIRKRLEKMDSLSDENIEKAFKLITKNGTDLSNVGIFTDQSLLNILDARIKEALDGSTQTV